MSCSKVYYFQKDFSDILYRHFPIQHLPEHRATLFSAKIAETTGFNSGTTTCTVKIVERVEGNSIIVAEANGNCYAMTTSCAGSYFGYMAIKKAGDKYVVGSLDDDILFYTKRQHFVRFFINFRTDFKKTPFNFFHSLKGVLILY